MGQTKPRLQLFYWHAKEGEEHADALRHLNYDVHLASAFSRELMTTLRQNPPHVFIIDLSRIPSHGREVAMALRSYKDTRSLPIVFVEGEKEKVGRTKAMLPDAEYATWDDLAKRLPHILKRPAVPVSKRYTIMDAWAGAPLAKKLGIKSDSHVVLIDAPKGFRDLLPTEIKVQKGLRYRGTLTMWFVDSLLRLQQDLPVALECARNGNLWICWPKQGCGRKTDLRQTEVRREGLAHGWVDYKICSIDATWSGLLFSKRKRGNVAT
jgi:CheY-like chemotaxis protein